MAPNNFNLDASAFELPTDGLIQPNLILLVSEDPDALVDPHLQPLPGIPQRNPPANQLPEDVHEQEEQAPPDTEDSLKRSVMAQVTDLRRALNIFQEFEGYLHGGNSGSVDSDVPDDSDDSDVSDDELEAMDEMPLVQTLQG